MTRVDEVVALGLSIAGACASALLARFFWMRRGDEMIRALGMFFTLLAVAYLSFSVVEGARLVQDVSPPVTWWRVQMLGIRALIVGSLWWLVSRMFNGSPRKR